MENLSIEEEVYGENCGLIKLKGFIDSTNASQFSDAIDSFTQKQCYHLVVDFSEIEYVSSAGWGVLISKIRDIREQSGDILLAGMIEGIRSIYKLMELDQIFTAFDSAQEALAVFPGERVTAGAVEESVPSSKAPESPLEELVDSSPQQAQTQSLEDEIKAIIAENPLISLRELPQELSKEEHGGRKVGWFQLRKMLNEMELGTLVQRLYYAFLKAKGKL
jgi:anti-sigma B factor antagonist